MKDNFNNDIPKYKKKSTASPPAKAKHKHEYVPCLIEHPWAWWAKPHETGQSKRVLSFRSYCPICGKIGDVDRDRWWTTVKKVDGGGRRYIESVKTAEAERELNPCTRTLLVFKVDSPFAKFVDIGKE